MRAEQNSSADHPFVELAAPSAEFPRCHFRLDRDLPAGSLIRVRAGGTQLLLGVAVDEVRISGAAQPLPFVHQFSRAEMERRWRWYITSMTMAVVRIEDDLRAGTALEVTASYGEHKMRGERASGRRLNNHATGTAACPGGCTRC